MRWLLAASVLALASCEGAAAPTEADHARAIAIEHFDEDAYISRLTPTSDGRAWCGMASWPPVEWGFRYPAPFIVEDGQVTGMGDDPEPYRRCGRNYVAPSTMPLVE